MAQQAVQGFEPVPARTGRIQRSGGISAGRFRTPAAFRSHPGTSSSP